MTRAANNRCLIGIFPRTRHELFSILRQSVLYENILHINNISMRQPRTQTQAQGSSVISVLSTYTFLNRLSYFMQPRASEILDSLYHICIETRQRFYTQEHEMGRAGDGGP